MSIFTDQLQAQHYRELNGLQQPEMLLRRSTDLSLILPAYNEASRSEEVINPISGKKEKLAKGDAFRNAVTDYLVLLDGLGISYELVVVDDGSLDETTELAYSLGVSKVIEYPDHKNRGRGYALKEGFRHTVGDARIYTDADGSYRPDTIREIYHKITNEGYDVAIAYRSKESSSHENSLRKIAHYALHTACELPFMAPTGMKDPQAGAKGCSASVANIFWGETTLDDWAADREALMIAQKNQLKIAQIEADIIPHGDSRVQNVRAAIKMLADSRKAGKAARNKEV
jgi:hypothetical protein